MAKLKIQKCLQKYCKNYYFLRMRKTLLNAIVTLPKYEDTTLAMTKEIEITEDDPGHKSTA